MKFQVSPDLSKTLLVQIILLPILSILFLFFALVQSALSAKIVMYLGICACIFIAYSGWNIYREMSFWISFDANGVTKEKKNTKISFTWEECKYIGFLQNTETSGYIKRKYYWIYLSKVSVEDKFPLSMLEKAFSIGALPKELKDENSFMRIEYRKDVMDDLLKYVDRATIHNYHLAVEAEANNKKLGIYKQ